MLDARQIKVAEAVWEPDAVDMFLFSAALWLPHRIHYDLDFAKAEGHRGLVVHGPLQIARLLEVAGTWSRPAQGRIVAADFRHVASAYVGDALRLVLGHTTAEPSVDGGETVLAAQVERIESAGTSVVLTTGTVTIAFPGAPPTA